MKNRALLWVALGAAGLYVAAAKYNEIRPTPPPPEPADKTSADQRVFRDKSGREIRFSTPLLDTFHYEGDAKFCAELEKLPAEEAFAETSSASCATLSNAKPEDRPEQFVVIATTTALAVAASDDDAIKNKGVALAFMSLRAALDEVPAEAPDEAFEILDKFWMAQLASNTFSRYEPPFLFGAAMQAESGEAQISLCPVTSRTDCNLYVPSGLMSALMDLGRWKSDENLLLRAAEMLERTYRQNANPTKDDELDFAEDYITALGYAGEISTERGAEHIRKGAGPLEAWLQKYEKETSSGDLEHIYGSLGAAYGRIAERTRTIPDAKKAIQFDTKAYELGMKHNDGRASWQDLSNLGDSTLLLGELESREEHIERALAMHRQAFEITRKSNNIKETSYTDMKLARTLQHYAAADFSSVSDAEKIPMLEESISLAQGIVPFFEKADSRIYLSITRHALEQAQAQLAKLQAVQNTSPK
jgi:tetratricopeptide (TPR) repeat protein